MGNLGDNISGIMRVIKYMNKTEKKMTNELHQILDDVLLGSEIL
jgi:hypothetical protein